METAKQYTYKNPGPLTTWLRIAVGVHLALLAASFVSFMMQYGFLLDVQNHAFANRDVLVAAAHANDARVQILGIFSLFAVVACVLSFLFWVYRASANAHALGAADLPSAGMAVGWFFIPFANFVMPAVAMGEIVRASADATNWKAQKSSWIVPVWWVMWLCMNVSGGITALVVKPQGDLASLEAVTLWLSAYRVIEVLAYIMILVLTTRVVRLQRAQHARQDGVAATFS